MENEEIRDLINKKVYEDQTQLASFLVSEGYWLKLSHCRLLVSSILELSHYSLSFSHSWTLTVFLGHFGIG